MNSSGSGGISLPTRVHFIGIGGTGLSAIATVLLDRGHQVSGSDMRSSTNTRRLQEEGAEVHIGHAAEHVGEAEAVVVSSAIPDRNVEMLEARSRGIPVLKREHVFSCLTSEHDCIAVAGTHGKTTTAAMIAWILLEAGCDPSFIVGGTLMGLGTNARAGHGPQFVVEADEYDWAFLGLRPSTAVLTHLERDHPDCFPDLAAMSAAFRLFLDQVLSQGTVIGCGDAPNVLSLLEHVQDERSDVRMLTYGLEDSWDWAGRDLLANTRGGNDFVAWQGPRPVGRVQLAVPGLHNVRNALGALAAAQQVGVPFDCSRKALATFRGTERRFEVKGNAAGVTVIDDYAHHPTQIRATLAAARRRYGERPLWVVFQPHTYSRTRMLLDQYSRSFADADHVIVTDIYAAREPHDPDISASMLVRQMTHPDARCLADLGDIVSYLLSRLGPGDVLITLGAGDGYMVGEGVLAGLEMEQDD